MIWDWDYARSILPGLLDGLQTTFVVTLWGSVVAFSLGLVWTILSRPRSVLLRIPATFAVQFLRGTPLLVQLYFAFYVLPRYGIVLSTFVTGALVLGLHYSAYASEVYRAGIESVATGQWEAARALSLPTHRIWMTIVLPVALRRSVPALATYMIAMYKETALLFAIGLPVLLFEARIAGALAFRYTEPYTMAGLLYFAVSYPSAVLLRRLETRHAQWN
jgi:polar amino acid transport system permease protein